MNGLALQLKQHLRANGNWVSKGTLTADIVWKHPKGKNYGKRYLPETVGRCLRSMEEDKLVAVQGDGISVKYRYIPEEFRGRYIPSSQRKNKEELWLQK